jgi:hypothetical protein
MDADLGRKTRAPSLLTEAFGYVEQTVYAVLGGLLCVTALLALGSAAVLL